ncbi:phosphatase [Syntrophomonas wolfei]|jgi:putative hydrolase|uniref:Phosphatase n=1 Tax=Syntrophomonas wolfei TaxID=863 RepID=A0A354YXE4_9FIRM|nr:phosphatase [Syntrophomonas wolfei]HBK53879.1 phosphatase [Syntrophomonas wolfei]
MKLEADLHIHTTASGHGYSTIKEIADIASEKGLKMIAITDHGLKMPGAPHWYYFTNLISLPRVMQGVEVLRGVEANILDLEGNVDMPEIVMSDYLDIVLAGFHDETGYSGRGVEENTQAMVAAIKNPYVHIIVHPGNPRFPIDVEQVVLAAKQYNKAIELNNSSFVVRPGSQSLCSQFAKAAKKHNALVSINSDAHICYNVGENAKAMDLALDAGIRNSQILNSSSRKIDEYLSWHRQQIKPVLQAQ